MSKYSQSAMRVGLYRGEFLESSHEVHGVVIDSTGDCHFSFGNPEQRIFPRSSIKPIQAVPIITTGAFDAKNVTLEELALACASHSGEQIHREKVSAWLNRMNLNSNDLQCGTHYPTSMSSTLLMAREKMEFSAICNNCSGKHTGMLSHAIHMGDRIKDYIHYDHPVQQRVKLSIEEFCEMKLSEGDFGIDGCSIPSFFVPMNKFALGMAKIADPKHLSDENKKAAQLIFKACTEYPILVAGTERYCTRTMLRTNKEILVKAGAEGVLAVSIKSLGLGIVVKCIDGSSRASEVVMSNLLSKYGILNPSKDIDLLVPEIFNWNKIKTGIIKIIG